MTISFPKIFSLGIDNMSQRINDLIHIGYTKKDVIKMTYEFPSLYSFSIDNIKQKINDLELLGFNLQEIIYMTREFPSLFGYHIDTIREKKEFYDSIGLGSIFLRKPKMLIQSVELSYARYMFYKSIGIKITVENCDKLFITEEIFKGIYKKTKVELLELYLYSREKIKRRIKIIEKK